MCLIQREQRLHIDLWFLRRQSDRSGEVQQQGIKRIHDISVIYLCGQIYKQQGVQSVVV